MEDATSDKSSVQLPRRFVSAQRRYDNARVRDSEITRRLCYDCGEIVSGGEREYQEHILFHEAVYLTYQLYHFEASQPADAAATSLSAAPPPSRRRYNSKLHEDRRQHRPNRTSGDAIQSLQPHDEATTSTTAATTNRMEAQAADKTLMSDGLSFSTTPTDASSQLSPPLAFAHSSLSSSARSVFVGAAPPIAEEEEEEAPSKSMVSRINEVEMEIDYMLE